MKTILLLLLVQQAHPEVDQNRVDQAIDKGAAWLLKQKIEPWKFLEHTGPMRHHDLVLYTLYHAGVDRENGTFKKLLQYILETPLERTYCVSVQAMLLSELDAVKYQWRIRQCCQFLVDNQNANGQWDYGREVRQDRDVPTSAAGGEEVSTGPGPQIVRRKPARVSVKRRSNWDRESGDNSNSQYATLGLRACMEANVWPPEATLVLTRDWWEKAQNKDGGWSYGGRGGPSYGSMTIGAVGALLICKYFLKEEWKRDVNLGAGVLWLIKNWTPRTNPGRSDEWTYYYLYAVERAGMLSGRDKFGPVDWYKDGAEFLLGAQHADGFWSEGNSWGGAMKDTCFAILFLRRATPPLPKVATGGKR